MSATGGSQIPDPFVKARKMTRSRRSLLNPITSRSNPSGPGLRRHVTPVDHIDGLVVDEHEHDPHLDVHEEERDSQAASTDSARTIIGNALQLGEPLDDFFLDSGNDGSISPSGGIDGRGDNRRTIPRSQTRIRGDHSDAERGQGIFTAGETFNQSRSHIRPNLSRQKSEACKDVWQDPRTRKWKDDIVTFDTTDDPANPKNWSSHKKLKVLILYGLSTMCATFASSVFSSASSYYADEYGITQEVAVLGVSLFVLGVRSFPYILRDRLTLRAKSMYQDLSSLHPYRQSTVENSLFSLHCSYSSVFLQQQPRRKTSRRSSSRDSLQE